MIPDFRELNHEVPAEPVSAAVLDMIRFVRLAAFAIAIATSLMAGKSEDRNKALEPSSAILPGPISVLRIVIAMRSPIALRRAVIVRAGAES